MSEYLEELARIDGGKINTQKKIHTVGELERELFGLFPAEQAEEWDNCGLSCGDAAEVVERIAIALDPTPTAVAAAAESGCNVLLTHHPAFLDALDDVCSSITGKDPAGTVVYDAVKAGVSIIAMHTNLDRSPRANGVLNRMLGLEPQRVLVPFGDEEGAGYGYLGKPKDGPMNVGQLAARVLSVFGRPPRVWGEMDKAVELVATLNGSGGSFVDEAVDTHASVLVTGEIGYHRALAAVQRGLCIIEMGHDVSELAMCGVLAQAVRELGVSKDRITLLDQSDTWRIPEARRV